MLKILTSIGLLTCLFGCIPQQESVPQPNIIVFLVDDMGWQDTSLPFHDQPTPLNKKYRTPNMERMAQMGMQFTQAYATSVCSPSRISLMTGMNAARHRVTNWTLRKNTPTDGKHPTLNAPDWNVNGLSVIDTIPKSVFAKTLPQALKEVGYNTIHVGKAHLAAMNTPCANPLNCGFDFNIAGHAAGAPGSYQGTENFGNNPDSSPREPWSVPGLSAYHGQDINLTEVLTREALHILDSVHNQSNPFFLYMSHYTVHTPIEADSRFFQSYLDQGIDTIEARYASMVEGMDKSLGDILDYLDENQLTDQTVIMFMSDNGGLSAVARSGTRHTHNAPLQSGKGSAFEGGIREPMLVSWPGMIEAGSKNHSPVIIEDFFPTILEIAGEPKLSVPQIVDGISLLPVLTQKNELPERDLIWHYPNFWGPSGPGIRPYSAIRRGPWKLIYWHDDQSYALFNLTQDIGELNNLEAQEIQTKNTLTMALHDFLIQVNAQMPSDKQTGKVVPYPSAP